MQLIDQLKAALLVVWNYFEDAIEHLRFSGTLMTAKKAVMQAKLAKLSHRVEKGLALPEPRPGFGVPVVKELIEDLETYALRFSADEVSQSAWLVLQAYRQFNHRHAVSTPDVDRALERLRPALAPAAEGAVIGGPIRVTQGGREGLRWSEFEAFVTSRHSVRTFAARPVDRGLLERAVRAAQWSPSACNRQSTKVHVFTHRRLIDELLGHQRGNSGFGETIPALLLITSDRSAFYGPNERNQAYIDGGMFAMTLVLALHALDLATCSLNLSLQNKEGRNLRRAAGIDQSEVLIMMLAVGYAPPEYSVAASQRLRVDRVMIMHGEN